MNAKEIVQTGLKALKSNDAQKMSSLAADDFVLFPRPVKRLHCQRHKG
jgi:ketosteroid isomerase-like protein